MSGNVQLALMLIATSPVAPDPGGAAAPRWKGTGLLAASGVAGAVGLGGSMGLIWVARHECDAKGKVIERSQYDPDGCLSSRRSALLGVAISGNLAAIALAPGGGWLRGRHDARRGVHRRRGVLFGLAGALAFVSLPVLVIGPPQSLVASSKGEKVGWILGFQAAATAFGASLGLFGHAAGHRRVALGPAASRDGAGLQLAGVF